jgi:cytidine deaminase
VAVVKALSEGHRTFTRIAVVTDTEAPTSPCGACRQVLWEFAPDLEVVLANLQSVTVVTHLRDLLPLAFNSQLLRRP